MKKLLTAKVICSSRSSWSAPIIVVPKGDGGKQLFIDYQALNKVTRKFTWPMPKVKDIFSKLNRAKYFSSLDLRAGYHHILLDKSSIPITAFNSPFSKYEYVKVPFGACSGSSIFSRINGWHFEGFLLCNSLFGWHNNIQQNSRKTSIPHQKVFEKLQAAKLSMKLSNATSFPKEFNIWDIF